MSDAAPNVAEMLASVHLQPRSFPVFNLFEKYVLLLKGLLIFFKIFFVVYFTITQDILVFIDCKSDILNRTK